MPTVTSENIGEVLQRIYDSEINIRLGWYWDAGIAISVAARIDYSVGTTSQYSALEPDRQ